MPLAPRGSVRDRIIEELFRREREERLTLVTGFVTLFAATFQSPSAVVAQVLEDYTAAVSHDVYTPEYTAKKKAALQKARAAARKKKSDDQALLQKVAKLSETEEPAPANKRRPSRGKR